MLHASTRRTALAAAALLAACSPRQPEAPQTAEPDAAAGGALENGSFTAELGGVSIHYEVHGQGPVVMAVPNSWGLSLGGLRALYRRLEERLTMVYFDPRGMGGSSPIREEYDLSAAAVREDFDALRRHLGLERVHAIGWSNGATNLILLASEKPGTLASAVFLHGAVRYGEEDMKAFSEEHPDLFAKFGVFQQEIGQGGLTDEQRTARQRAFWLEQYFPFLFADPEAGRGRIRELFEGVELSWPHAAYAEREFPGFDFTDRLAAIDARSLVVAGAADLLAPSEIEELHRGLADSRFEVFEDSGHFSPVEEPDRFEAVLYEFLGVD